MIIQHNMTSLGIQRHMGITNKGRAKSSERLASGYRVNRASDDAAALSISEKMRGQIRGLVRAVQNADDAISFVQTGDGAMNEMTNILHRMRELAVQSMNDTYTDEDRACIQSEFDQLQSEIDKISKETQFNTLQVFEQHMPTYYSVKGAVQWDQGQQHLLETSKNLKVTVSDEDGSNRETYEIWIPAGIYTTQELIDEIEDAFEESGAGSGVALEFTKDGYCNLNFEGGEFVESVGGSLAYLLYDSYMGGGLGSLIGTTQFEGSYPLNIVAGRNDTLQFYLQDEMGNYDEVNITVPSGNYTRQQMIDYLNTRLAGKGVSAKEYGENCIEISGEGYMVTGLKGNMFQLDTSGTLYTSVFYDNVKYGSVTHTNGYIQGNAGYSRTDANYNKIKIDGTNNQLYIRVNADSTDPYTLITLEEKEYTVDEMIAALNQAFADEGLDAKATKEYVNHATYGWRDYIKITSNMSGNGSKVEVDQAKSTAYKVLFQDTKYFVSRSVYASRTTGSAGSEPYFRGAKAISSPITLDASNNVIQLNVDGTTYTLTLTAKTYNNAAELITEINSKINDNAGIKDKVVAQNYNGSTNRIQFTTASADNGVNSISVSSASSAYKELFQVVGTADGTINFPSGGTASQITLNKKIEDSVTITNSNNTLSMVVDGVTRTVTFANGTYTPDQLVAIINDKLKPTTTTTTTINDFKQSSSGVYVPPLQGSTVPQKAEPAVINFTQDLPSSVTIDGTNNTFILNVNGTDRTFTLSNGTYSRDQLINEMNTKLSGYGVTASLNGNKVTLKSQVPTSTSTPSLSIESKDGSGGGTFLSVLVGTTTTTTTFNGVTASLDGSGQLVLSGNGKNISLRSGSMGSAGKIFVTVPQVPTTSNPTSDSRVSGTTCYVQGQPFTIANGTGAISATSPLTIDSKNKELKFTYSYNGTTHNVDIQLAEGSYTSYGDLQTELQNKINAALGGSGKLNVTVSSSGVRLEASANGANSLTYFSGGFYTYVITQSYETTANRNPAVYSGNQVFDPAYIVGRKDVKNNTVTINPYINDTLVFDFTHPDENGNSTVTTIEIKLAGGTYNGDALVKEIQDKLNVQLVANGFEEGFIKAAIGGINTGVVGSNDATALNFQVVNKAGENITPGAYVIDGVRGSAAFYTFYRTEGEPVPAYVTGTKDLSNGVSIVPGKNEFSFTADGVTYTYEIPEGEYTAEEFLELFNDMLGRGDKNGNVSPVQAIYNEYGQLKITYSTLGRHIIDDITGSAKGSIFFEEEGRIDGNTDLNIQVGANAQQMLNLERLLINTYFMKINTVTVSKSKYANKALDRLDYALNYINRAHSLYGAKQNRLSHVVSGNGNTAENLQASESKLRDADMAKEMVVLSKNTILLQAAQSLMAQANQNNEGVLTILR